MDFLTGMAEASRARSAAARADRDDAEIARIANSRPAPAPLILSHDGFDLIAEVKKNSPSAGALAGAELSPAVQGRRYADAGAAAISVLTEPNVSPVSSRTSKRSCGGRHGAGDAQGLPRSRLTRSFEARAHGASGVLLVAAMFDARGVTRHAADGAGSRHVRARRNVRRGGHRPVRADHRRRRVPVRCGTLPDSHRRQLPRSADARRRLSAFLPARGAPAAGIAVDRRERRDDAGARGRGRRRWATISRSSALR